MPSYLKLALVFFVLAVTQAILFSRSSQFFSKFVPAFASRQHLSSGTTTMSSVNSSVPTTQEAWREALASLPATPENIPAFFFAHGSPSLAFPKDSERRLGGGIGEYQGPEGPLAKFLKDFGPVLLEKYKPKAIVVFSAHWETTGERMVTDYGDENPLLYDYYGFPPELYKLKFKSRGDSAIAQKVVQLYKDAGYLARTTNKLESRGEDGRGFAGPGLDHGVFVPFQIMFGEELDIPVIQVSIDSKLTPESNWKLGQIVASLRKEQILVLSGGLPIHNLRDFSSFHPQSAKPLHHSFHQAILDALMKPDPTSRKQALHDLTKHQGFRACNPREEHFVPLYIAAGAGEDGEAKILNGLYGIPTVAFV